jgi:predicted Fe-S protein YdhL (DUF1289 family)
VTVRGYASRQHLPGHCVGCWRSLAEIAGWASMSDSDRRAIMAELPLRKMRLEAAEG